MSTRSRYGRPALPRRPRWGPLAEFLATAAFAAALVSPLDAQESGSFRLWAAQTGANQVSSAWDSVPGAREYRIFLSDLTAPGTLQGRPASVLGAGATSAILTGLQRMVKGITLVAVDASGRVLRQESFNPVVPATSFPPPTPPTSLTAEAPTASEVTVTWDPVPGATAYFIGRAVFQSGFSVLCALCPSEPRYVDRSVMAGQPHTYTIAAILPSGVSTRTNSNSVTPGETLAPSTTPVQPRGTTSGSNPGTTQTPLPGGSTTPPPGQPAGTLPTYTGTGSTSTTGSGVPAAVVEPPTLVHATISGPGSVHLSWRPSGSPGVSGYYVQRNPSGSLVGMVTTVPATQTWFDDCIG